jgi:hypothetical protein
MMALHGAVSLKELLQLPAKQYSVLKNAVDICEIERRKVYIHDAAMAFSDPQKAITELNRTLNEITKSKSSIIWDADSDSIDRAKRKYMR